MMPSPRPQQPIAVTMGEPAGIGGELSLMAWQMRTQHTLPRFFVIDDPARLERLARDLGWEVAIRPITAPEQAADVWDTALPVLPLAAAVPAVAGRPDPANGAAVLRSIEQAVALAVDRRVAAIVTNPIQKNVLYQAGFSFPGHTEYLAALAGSTVPPVMMLACPQLRVVPVTVHLPLKEVAAHLTTGAIIHCAEITAASLERDFGLTPPRLTIAALNPHAGENGAMGREETDIIMPAVQALKARGLAVDGPHPADTLFHARAREQYDAAICMYHDQALLPLKTIDFDRGVNITLGLPFVRTSPDHGTALPIAGKGIAKTDSFIEALLMAERIAAQRARRPMSAGDLA